MLSRYGDAVAVFDALDAAMDAVAALDSDTFTTFERFEALERCERIRRRLPSLEHGMINQIAREATAEELGGKLS
ncbi:MAG: hypothetical protein JOZ23_10130, partial [Mycobacterium sp.]|nr:hypothetical protein [Mycobacterium sp.]